MNITLDDFGLEWDHGDGVKHKADYDDLAEVYEKYGERQWIPVSERMPGSGYEADIKTSGR